MSEVKMWYGCTDFKPFIVNPTREELSEYTGKKLTFEPRYIFDRQDGTKVLKIDIWGECPEANNIKVHLTFWVEDALEQTKDGRQRYINGQGITSYKTDVLPKFIYNGNFRPAHKGEDLLAMFISRLTPWKINLDKFKDGAIPNHFMDMERILNGDMHDIEKVFKIKNTVKVYLGVVPTGNGYLEQVVYPKYFQYSVSKNCTEIMNALANKYTEFKGNIAPLQEMLVLKELSKVGSSSQAESALAVDDHDDDLPF